MMALPCQPCPAQVEEISEAAKLNQRMAAVEIALSSIGDVVMEKAARKQESRVWVGVGSGL